jgi:hypothetical protein
LNKNSGSINGAEKGIKPNDGIITFSKNQHFEIPARMRMLIYAYTSNKNIDGYQCKMWAKKYFLEMLYTVDTLQEGDKETPGYARRIFSERNAYALRSILGADNI